MSSADLILPCVTESGQLTMILVSVRNDKKYCEKNFVPVSESDIPDVTIDVMRESYSLTGSSFVVYLQHHFIALSSIHNGKGNI